MLMWMEPYWIKVTSALASVGMAILGLCFLIFIHELGHFIVAKRSGVKVEVFSLGVAHFIVSWTWRGTVYALSWLPLGGYVRMAGQQDLAPPPDHRPQKWEYGAKRPVVRMAIISAGVIMNFIFGWVCFSASFMVGREVESPVVGRLAADTYSGRLAIESGLKEGDKIDMVNGDPVYGRSGLEMRVGREHPGSLTKPSFVELLVKRKGEPGDVTVKVPAAEGRFRGVATISHLLGEVVDGSKVSFRAGFDVERKMVVAPNAEILELDEKWAQLLVPDERVVAVDGRAVAADKDLREAIRASTDGVFTLTVSSAEKGEREVRISGRKRYEVGALCIPELGAMVIDRVLADSPAEAAGLRGGDEIMLSGRQRPCSFSEFTEAIKDCGDGELRVVARSLIDGKKRDVVLHPRRTWDLPCGETLVVSDVVPGSAAEAKGLKCGAVVFVKTDARGREPVTAWWYLAGEKHGPYVLPRLQYGPEVEWDLHVIREQMVFGDPRDAALAGWIETKETVLQTTVLVKKIVGGQATPKVMSGPLGIAQAAYTLAEQGLGHMLWLLGLLGVSLALINFLPIPVLDGGHMVFLVYEAVFRRPPSPRVVEVAQYAGLLIILSLFAFAFWNDITR